VSRRRAVLCPECGAELTVRREVHGAVVVRRARCEECGWRSARVYLPGEVEGAGATGTKGNNWSSPGRTTPQ